MLAINNLYDPNNIQYLFHLLNALKALNFFKRDRDYIIQDGEVIIVDEFTGDYSQAEDIRKGYIKLLKQKKELK